MWQRNWSELIACLISPPACWMMESIELPAGEEASLSHIPFRTFFIFDGAIGPHLRRGLEHCEAKEQDNLSWVTRLSCSREGGKSFHNGELAKDVSLNINTMGNCE